MNCFRAAGSKPKAHLSAAASVSLAHRSASARLRKDLVAWWPPLRLTWTCQRAPRLRIVAMSCLAVPRVCQRWLFDDFRIAPSTFKSLTKKDFPVVPQEGIEPPTRALRMRCSTPELLRRPLGRAGSTRTRRQDQGPEGDIPPRRSRRAGPAAPRAGPPGSTPRRPRCPALPSRRTGKPLDAVTRRRAPSPGIPPGRSRPAGRPACRRGSRSGR